MCRREQRRWRERAIKRGENRFATPEVVEHRSQDPEPEVAIYSPAATDEAVANLRRTLS